MTVVQESSTSAEATASFPRFGYRCDCLSPKTYLPKPGWDVSGDAAILDKILRWAIPRRDVKRTTRALLARFTTFPAVIAAPISDLMGIELLGESGIVALKTIHAAALRFVAAELAECLVLSNWERLMGYLNAKLAREQVEQSRVLFLDQHNRLIADELHRQGSVSHAPVYSRDIIKRALELHANALILVHNHPSGDPTPSAEDIAITLQVKAAAEVFSMTLYDHVIVGNGRWWSCRRHGLL